MGFPHAMRADEIMEAGNVGGKDLNAKMVDQTTRFDGQFVSGVTEYQRHVSEY